MNAVVELEAFTKELAAAARTLGEFQRHQQTDMDTGTKSSLASLVSPSASTEVHEAWRRVVSSAGHVQRILAERAGMVQHVAIQVQVMACLQWLGEFRVLACIPRSQSVAIQDVAVLCSVPEMQLARVVRMTATAGFLCEPEPGRVAHTAASQQFAGKPSVGDAAMFVAERVTSAAVAMAAGTRRDRQAPPPRAFEFPPPAGQQPKARRQWAAFMQHAGGRQSSDDAAADVLARLDWANLGGACVVDVGAEEPQLGTCLALAARYPRLQLVVQRGALPVLPAAAALPSIALQTRAVGDPQPVRDAAVYILRLPHPQAVTAELRVHLPVLAASPRATLLIVPTRLLPEPGSVDADTEAAARMRDLSLAQLTGHGGLERYELLELIAAARDRLGRLEVVSELRARNNMLVAVRVCYQAHRLLAPPS